MPKTYKQEFADVQSAYMEAMEQVRFWGEKFDTLYAEAEQDRLDAQRYRKLRAKLVRTRHFNDSGNAVHFFVCQEGEFDSTVDALPELEK